MGIISKAISNESRSLGTLKKPTEKLISLLGGRTGSKSGVKVSEDNVLTLSGVYAAVKVLSETLASLDPILYRRTDRGKKRATNNDLYNLVKSEPNPQTTSYQFKISMMYHATLKGNSFAWIERDVLDRVKAIWQLQPRRVTIDQDQAGNIFYRYENTYNEEKPYKIPQRNILHITGMTRNGVVGLSLIEQILVESMGMAKAAQNYAARWFANSATNGIIATYPGKLEGPTKKKMKQQLRKEFSTNDNTHGIKILDNDLDFEEIGVDPKSSQLLETRRFTVEEAARIWRIPQHLLGNLENATYSNIENQSREFQQYTMMPWTTQWEQELNKKLLLPEQKNKYFFEFLYDKLLRADSESRAAYYQAAVNTGWMSHNDVRRKENMNPIEGGDEHYRPLNLVPLNSSNPNIEEQQNNNRTKIEHRENAPDPYLQIRKAAKNGYNRIFQKRLTDVVEIEKKEVLGILEKYIDKRDQKQAVEQISRYYNNDFLSRAQDKIQPAVDGLIGNIRAHVVEELSQALGEAEWSDARQQEIAQNFTTNWSKKHAAKSQGLIQKEITEAASQDDNVIKAVRTKYNEWLDERVIDEAADTATAVESYTAREIYHDHGYNTQWALNGGSCSLCRAMEGKVVSRNNDFLPANQKLSNEGKELQKESSVGHPPLHGGCDCGVKKTLRRIYGEQNSTTTARFNFGYR